MMPLRILMVADVSPALAGGGGERVLWEQGIRLARRGHRVRILSRSPGDDAAEVVERQGVGIHHFPVDRRSASRFLLTSILGARRAAARALAEAGADVLNVHQPLSGYGALASREGRRIPSLYTFHSPAPLEYRSRRGMTGFHRGGWAGAAGAAVLWVIEQACLRRADRIHVLSDFSADQLRSRYRLPAERIVRIPGGVDADRFRPAADRDAVRAALGLPPGRPLLLTVRNLEARMGIDTLIRSMAILRRAVPEALLLIGGAGSLRGELERLSGALGLGEQVRFVGFIAEGELPLYYQAADVFVLPTRELEGFGLVTVEALACGTPVLGTPVAATPEILRPLNPSLLFRDTTAEIMAEDLEKFVVAIGSDTAATQRLRQACRRHAEAHYTWNASVDRLEALMGQLVATDASSSAARAGGEGGR